MRKLKKILIKYDKIIKYAKILAVFAIFAYIAFNFDLNLLILALAFYYFITES